MIDFDFDKGSKEEKTDTKFGDSKPQHFPKEMAKAKGARNEPRGGRAAGLYDGRHPCATICLQCLRAAHPLRSD